jgi:uncharacterized protein YqeY
VALKEQIQADMKAALLGGNRFEGNVLSNLKAAILNEEVAQGKRDEGLDDTTIETIIAREVKKRNESIKLYEENDRPELAEEEKKELTVLKNYLPEAMSEEAIRDIVDTIIGSMNNPAPQQIGQVIGAVKTKAGNAADGALVARIAKEQLNK